MRSLLTALETIPVATALVVLVLLTGAIVTITNPDALSFDQYYKYALAGLGLLGVGRGVAAARKPAHTHREQPPREW